MFSYLVPFIKREGRIGESMEGLPFVTMSKVYILNLYICSSIYGTYE